MFHAINSLAGYSRCEHDIVKKKRLESTFKLSVVPCTYTQRKRENAFDGTRIWLEFGNNYKNMDVSTLLKGVFFAKYDSRSFLLRVRGRYVDGRS